MGNLRIFNFIALLFFLSLLSGCGYKLSYLLSDRPKLESPKFLDLKLTQTSGEELDLSKVRDQNIVLMFASIGCTSCAKEIDLLKKDLPRNGLDDSETLFITNYVSTDQSMAQRQKDRFGIFWTVTFQDHAEDLAKYCPENLTPCTIISTPEKGIVDQHTGVTDLKYIQRVIGTGRPKTPGDGDTDIARKKDYPLYDTLIQYTGKDINETTHDLSKKDKVLLVNVSSTDAKLCPDCVTEIQGLQGANFPKERVEIVTFLPYESKDKALEFKQNNQITWPVLYGDLSDEAFEMVSTYCPKGQNYCLLIQFPRKGLQYYHEGDITPIRSIEAILKGWEKL